MNIHDTRGSLFQKRQIFLYDIEVGDAKRIEYALLGLAVIGSEQIELCITSIGGDVPEALNIYKIIRDSAVPVIGIVQKKANSMAPVVLQACKERRMYRNATMGLHLADGHLPPHRTLASGKFNRRLISEEMDLIEKNVKEFRTVIRRIYSARSGLSEKRISAILAQDRNFSAEEALDLCFIDSII